MRLLNWLGLGCPLCELDCKSGCPCGCHQKKPKDASRRFFILGMGAAAVAPFIPDIKIEIPELIVPVKPEISNAEIVALQLEKIRDKLPLLYERDDMFFKYIKVKDTPIGPSTTARIPMQTRWYRK